MTKTKHPSHGIYEAAGGLLWREDGEVRRLAIVHRPQYDDWTLPKGTRKKGETWQQAALREVLEETGCAARLGEFAGCVCYQIERIPKLVLFWHMRLAAQGEFCSSDEVDAVEWLAPAQALQRLSYTSERQLLAQFADLP
jgi:8-oxo-dGTP diphosphatase